ncbi:MAG: hypothetical protein PWQ17_2249 [Anaerophaga sp.]|nr:hypothetical protein [Anaerophaga sp.]MDN5290313.1 hypothetical protein [Anaerophaga sp.]
MNKLPYIIKRLDIRKMPGFPGGLRPFDDLSSDINIVSGPNASGKSSTARLIQQLIWHKHTIGLEANASILLDNQEWDIKIDHGKIQVLHEGREESITGLPAAEGSHRYFLALQDMVAEEDQNAAETIARESIGGYNLDLAKEELGYSDAIFTKNIGEFKALDKAIQKYHATLSNQERIKREENSLDKLYKEKEEAELDRQRSSFFKTLAEFLNARNAYNQINTKLEQFYPSMDKLTGNEPEQIEKLEQQIRHSKNIIEQSNADIEEKTRKLGQLTIPKSGVASAVIEELENRTENIKELTRTINDNEEKIETLKIQSQEALKNIDVNINPSEWEGLDLNDVGQLDRFLQRAHNLLGRKAFLNNQMELLTQELTNLGELESDGEKISSGINILNNWLTGQQAGKETPNWLVPLLIVLGAVTAIATFFFGWPGLSGIILMAGAWIFSNLKTTKQDTLQIREQDYRKTGLKQPGQWHPNDVVELLNDLVKDLQKAHHRDDIIRKQKDIEKQLRDTNSELKQLEETRNQLIEKIKTAPHIPEISENDYTSLVWFIENLKKWQKSHLELLSLQTKTRHLKSELQTELAKCNQIFSETGSSSANDISQIKATLSELKRQENDRCELVRQIQQSEKEIDNQDKLLKEARQELSEIYSRLDIDEGKKGIIRQMIEQLKNYKSLKDNLIGAKAGYQEKERLLKNHPLYSDYKQETEHLTAEEALDKSEEYARHAGNWETIIEQIKEIENAVRQIKNGHELEDVLTRKENALTELEDVYHNNISGFTGHLIVEELKAQTRDQNRPQVFRAAGELFNRITAGRYELRLDNKEQAVFTAYDTVLKLEQPLSQLSTGTRVQLLLAVRLAFIEKQEETIKLPLLADELLANSDDERASAIIQALIEISREGRQIFYFTAQDDEVKKWFSFLKSENDIHFTHVALTGDSGISYSDNISQISPEDIKFSYSAPRPEEKNHAKYGEALAVSPFSLLTDDITSLHLWYLIDDVNLLYRCLQKGIRQWGQLQSFVQNNGRISGLDDDTWQIICNKAELLERFKELYTIGRPKPVGRDVLMQSGLISDTFIDAVTEKAVELNGNPEQLLLALKNGEVPRFYKTKTEELADYFTANNYIDENEPMPMDDILLKLQAFISESGIDAKDAEEFLRMIIDNRS